MNVPLVLRAYGYGPGTFIWLARRFRPGSSPNMALYAISDRIIWRRMKRRWPSEYP